MTSKLKFMFLTYLFLMNFSYAFGLESVVGSVVEFKPPPKNLSQINLIDARNRDTWLEGRLPKSIFLDWDHFSQPGIGSRGSLRTNPQIIVNDLALIGLDINQPIYVYGFGAKGEGSEGRLAWMLYWLGFKKIYVTNFKTAQIWSGKKLEKGPYFPVPTKSWTAKLRTDLLLSLKEYKKWRAEKKPHILIDLRGQRADVGLPGIYSSSNLNIDWKTFIRNPEIVRSNIDNYISQEKFDKSKIPIISISFAGLKSAYVALLLNSWGYKTYLIPDGYSMEIKD